MPIYINSLAVDSEVRISNILNQYKLNINENNKENENI